jgi:hypothetical protein
MKDRPSFSANGFPSRTATGLCSLTRLLLMVNSTPMVALYSSRNIAGEGREETGLARPIHLIQLTYNNQDRRTPVLMVYWVGRTRISRKSQHIHKPGSFADSNRESEVRSSALDRGSESMAWTIANRPSESVRNRLSVVARVEFSVGRIRLSVDPSICSNMFCRFSNRLFSDIFR